MATRVARHGPNLQRREAHHATQTSGSHLVLHTTVSYVEPRRTSTTDRGMPGGKNDRATYTELKAPIKDETVLPESLLLASGVDILSYDGGGGEATEFVFFEQSIRHVVLMR